MSQTISRTYPDPWVTRMIPAVDPVDERLQAVSHLDIVPKILTYMGVADIASLTPTQKPEVVCAVFLWQLVANSESDDAGTTARDTAYQTAIDDYEPGT